MDSSKLEQFSRTELIEVILQQQDQLRTLQVMLLHLENQLLINEQKNTIEGATRNALRNLDNVAYLGRSPLIILMAKIWQIQLNGRSLQRALYQAIEALKPVEGQPNWHHWQLRYDILRLIYYEKKRPPEIAAELSISERQYYRELKAAIQTVVEHLSNLQ